MFGLLRTYLLQPNLKNKKLNKKHCNVLYSPLEGAHPTKWRLMRGNKHQLQYAYQNIVRRIISKYIKSKLCEHFFFTLPTLKQFTFQ